MGGTGMFAVNESVGRLEPKGKGGDAMGRWSFFTLRRQGFPPVTIISVYQVCPQPTNRIGYTAWHQQRRQLDLEHRDEHPRTAFIADLSRFISHLQAEHHDIILGGDWNETVHDQHSGIAKMCLQYDLIDPWTIIYPDHPDVATFEFGSKRIDAVIVSRRLIPHISCIGYTPVGLFSQSDHRAVLISFHTKALFGNLLESLQSPASRSVRSKDRTTVTTFVETMHQHLLDNNAFKRGDTLANSDAFESGLAESLDKIVGEAGDIGEHKCQRRRLTWFSTSIVQDRLEISHLQHYRNGLKFGRDRTVITATNLTLIDRNQPLPPDLLLMDTLLHQKETAFAAKIAKSAEIRQAELQDKAAQLDEAKERKHASILRTISRRETGQAAWRALAFNHTDADTHQKLDRLDIPATWPSPHTDISPTTQLEDPKTTTAWTTITHPLDIEYYLLLRNRNHFGQAQGTPFTISPLRELIDWTATTPESEAILNGQYVPPTSMPSLCQQVLNECKASITIDSIPPQITAQALSGKIKAWREKTTTSPSGRHLGRYKALFTSGKYLEAIQPEEYKTFEQKQKDIAVLLLSIINYCITHGYVLERWKQIVNTMIFKDIGVHRIHRLRVIHIYEADLNLILAVKWRELLYNADRAGAINESQYGGRPGREATSLALLEELRIDISYLTRRSLITFDNDAASCYDRIIPSFASLINRKYGLHRRLALLHGHTLKQARYKLRTAIGISALEYSHCEEFPLYGSGQGSGNSPALWLFISATLFNIHDREAYGAKLQDPQGKHTVQLHLSGFVDDTNAALNDWQPQDEVELDTLLDRLRHDAQLWNDLLFISGGKLPGAHEMLISCIAVCVPSRWYSQAYLRHTTTNPFD